MNYEVKEQMYEGKAKQVFATSDPEIVMVHYKDDATAGDGEKKGTIRDKGIVNNKLSNALMQKLEKEGIPTHYVQEINDRDTFVKKVEICLLYTSGPGRLHSRRRYRCQLPVCRLRTQE